MAESPPVSIRNSAKAVIIDDGRVLVERALWRGQQCCFLPGGGQHPGEALHDTVRREVLEETGLTVTPQRLLWVREYVGRHHQPSTDAGIHRVDFFFLCTADHIPGQLGGTEPDASQIGLDWIALQQITDSGLLPVAVRQPIAELAAGTPPCGYLGDVG